MNMSIKRPQQQLQGYFDDLLDDHELAVLNEPTPEVSVAEQEPLEVNPSLQKWQKEQLQSLLKNLAPVPEDILDSSLITHTVPAVIEEPVNHQAQSHPLPYLWNDNGRPEWAQKPFDVLLVTVRGVHLALPLRALDGIYPLDDKLTPLFEQPKWCMGLKKTLIGNIKIVDTELFIMPESYKETEVKQYHYCLPINDSGWGLAIDSMYQPVTIDPNTIKWRKNRQQRQWVAGTLKDHLCVLLDIPTFAGVLQRQQ